MKKALLTVLLFTALAFSTPDPNQPPEKNAQPQCLPSSFTDRQLWALGASAVLIERNHGCHDLLGADIKNTKNIEKCKQFLLVAGWNVNDRKELIKCLTWLKLGGHREVFNDIGKRLFTLSADQYSNLLDQYKDNKDTLNEIKVVAHYSPLLGPKSLLGWDYSRYICLCRWGYMAGYLTEQEAWDRIMPVAKLLQKTFDSWQDLGQNYLIGRQFWSYDDKDRNITEEAYMRLNDMSSSPWNKLPWDLDLSKK
jgi:hypothetical protein